MGLEAESTTLAQRGRGEKAKRGPTLSRECASLCFHFFHFLGCRPSILRGAMAYETVARTAVSEAVVAQRR